MNTFIKRAGSFIRNCVELYIPLMSFVVLFLVFCFQVFMRYIMKNPQPWTLEVEQMCFLWLVLLGACYTQREKSHVTFTLFYDKLGIKGKAITSMLGNIIIAATFFAATIPSLKYIWGQQARAQVTSILKVPKTLVFFPFVFFLVIIFIYAVLDIYQEAMVLKGDPYYISKMININKSEVELAIESASTQEPLCLSHSFDGEPEKEED